MHKLFPYEKYLEVKLLSHREGTFKIPFTFITTNSVKAKLCRL